MTTASTKPLAVVTGASSGIGFELAKQFAQNGFDLLVVSNSEALAKAAPDFEQLGAQVITVQAAQVRQHDEQREEERARTGC